MSGHTFSDADLAEGRRHVADLDRAQWALGDLAVAMFGPPPTRGAHDPNADHLAEFADAIGIAARRLADYRSTAHAFPTADRIDGASWTLHRTVTGRPDRADVLTEFVTVCKGESVAPTRDRLRAHLAGRDDACTIQIPATIDEAIAQFRELAAEEQALADTADAAADYIAENGTPEQAAAAAATARRVRRSLMDGHR